MHPLSCLTLLLIGAFVLSSVFFATSMLSATVVVSSNGTESCQGVRRVDQVVVILIDALRPDFVLSALRAYNREDGECVMPQTSEENRRRYMGSTLRYMERCLSEPEDASYGYFLVADAPTTTAQRIKAIATGTMPAFLEAGSNFNSDATPLDSIVRQTGGRAVLLGDDTWTKLFPDSTDANGKKVHWKRTVALPSFDVADFHTNDDAVLRTVFNVLENETKEKDNQYAELIIAHFLGVDHVGHRFNAENSEMAEKLRQLNVMLHNVTVSLRQRQTTMSTMVIVLGDHGMTSSGDHGGGSPLETDTFLFAQFFAGNKGGSSSRSKRVSDLDDVSRMSEQKKKLVHELNADRWEAKADEELARLASCQQRAEVRSEKLGAAYQVDVTPTITVLLGKPIPFSSFGRVLPEVLALADEHVDLDAVEQCNLAQMKRYFEETQTNMPSSPSWDVPGMPLRTRVARMSFFARRTRTDMDSSGMFVGSTLVLVCALSIFYVKEIRDVFVQRTPVLLWTGGVFVARLLFVFSNSFVVNEDVQVFTLLGTLLVLGAMHAPRGGRALFLVGLLACMRMTLPYAIRHREHISHNVESSSYLDHLAVAWLPLEQCERAGIVTLWGVASIAYGVRRSLRASLWVAAACAVMCASYKIPVVHHAAPLLLGVGYTVSWVYDRRRKTMEMRPALFSYLLGVAWVCSLCNEKCVVAVIIALYGATLPLLCRALQHMPVQAQAVTLHLAAYVAFFFQGHQCMLNTIDWNASFVGMPFYNIVLGAVLVLSRTFNAFLFVPVAYRVAATLEEGKTKDRERNGGSSSPSESAMLCHLIVHLGIVQGAVSCFNGYIQKNHLMMFPIFCPKLIFDVVIAFATGAGFFLSMAV